MSARKRKESCLILSSMGDRHHYVPRFYLRSFSIPGRDEFVWAYRRNESPKDLHINAVAVRKNFYKYTDSSTGQRSNEIEDFYSYATESPTAPVFRKIIAMDELSLTVDEREIVAHFIAHLITRNPRYRRMQDTFLDVFDDWVEFVKDEESFIAGLVDLGYTTQQAQAKRSEVLLDPEEYFRSVRASDELTVSGSLFLAIEFTKAMLNRQWQLVLSDCNRVFVASDNPVSSIAPAKAGDDSQRSFINQLLYLPICPSKCLLISRGDGFAETLRLGRQQVDEVNRYTMLFAHSSVYSNVLSKDVEERFNKRPAIEDERAAFFRAT